MKKLLRSILKNILGVLSRSAIAKHNAEVIVVIGWTGSSIVRELIYNMLEDEFNVRRNTKEVWWDFSIPMTILGYKDKKRSIIGWIYIISKVYFSLFFRKRYSHKIIINMDTSYEDIADYWSKYIHPDIVVLQKENPSSKLVKKIIKANDSEKTLFVYDPRSFKGFGEINIREFKYSSKNAKLIYNVKGKILKMKYKDKGVEVDLPEGCLFLKDLIPAAFSVGILEGIDMDKLKVNLRKFSFHPRQLKKGMKRLKKFLHKNK